MDATGNRGLMDYDTMTDELYALDGQTDADVLRETVARYSAYGCRLARKLNEQVLAGTVEDAGSDHLHVCAEVLTRAVERLAELGAVEVTVSS
jgi:hypothetical protein